MECFAKKKVVNTAETGQLIISSDVIESAEDICMNNCVNVEINLELSGKLHSAESPDESMLGEFSVQNEAGNELFDTITGKEAEDVDIEINTPEDNDNLKGTSGLIDRILLFVGESNEGRKFDEFKKFLSTTGFEGNVKEILSEMTNEGVIKKRKNRYYSN